MLQPLLLRLLHPGTKTKISHDPSVLNDMKWATLTALIHQITDWLQVHPIRKVLLN